MTGAVVGFDPASTNYLGLARVEGNQLELLRVRVYARDAGGLSRTWRERVEPTLSRWWPGVVLAVTEVPPPTMRKDAGRSGSQAVIGYGIGRATGYLEHAAMLAGVPVELAGVGEIRRAMAPFAPPAPISGIASNPALTALPPVRAGDGWTVRYAGCAHAHVAATLAALQARPPRCPSCEASRRADRAQDARAAAKRTAWDTFSHRWPVHAAQLVVEASKGTDDTLREPWAFPGAGDAAEAALNAWYGTLPAR